MVRFGKVSRKGPIRCFIKRDMIHADYVFESSLWSDLFPAKGRFVKIGWGDKKIFLETATWGDLKIKDFMRAFFGMNDSVLKVDFTDEVDEGLRFFDMEEDQLEAIRCHVMESTNRVVIEKSAGDYEFGDFYESDLRYNCITNCNNWIGRGLRKARLSNGFWFPLPLWI